MRWNAVLVVLSALALIAGIAHFAFAQEVSEGSYVRAVEADGKHAKIEFMVPVDVVYAEKTGSMRPTFDDDALIVTEPENLQVGDIVVYSNGERLIVHRIVGVEVSKGEMFYRLKGDNNFLDDGLFPESAIKWKVVGILY